jgi:hypothetical protein
MILRKPLYNTIHTATLAESELYRSKCLFKKNITASQIIHFLFKKIAKNETTTTIIVDETADFSFVLKSFEGTIPSSRMIRPWNRVQAAYAKTLSYCH